MSVLVDNAIRYSPSKTPVDLIVTLKDDGSPQIVVSDHGTGIRDSEKDKIFERFYRVLGNDEPGSGLGLSIAYEICLKQGIQIEIVDNPSGKGTQFVLTLPKIAE